MQHSLETEIIIKSQTQATLLRLASQMSITGTETVVKFRTWVQYKHRRGAEEYELPAIADGRAEQAKEALERLWRQCAISLEQYNLIKSAIDHACILAA